MFSPGGGAIMAPPVYLHNYNSYDAATYKNSTYVY